MNKIFIFIISFFIIVSSVAQDLSNSAMVEQNSAELYYDNNWSGLISYGNKAIAQGYDYFHLRLRVGIAYYELKKYMLAVKHFEKAVKFNSSDNTALEYLYYSYIFSGRNSEARALTSIFQSTLWNKIKPPKNKYIESVYCEGGPAFSNQTDIKNADINGTANIYGEATITNTMRYMHIGLNHQFGNKISIYQGYCNININMARKINTNNNDTIDNYSLTQHDYYFSPNYQFKHFSVSPAFHLINVKFGKLNASYDNINYKYIFSKKDTSFLNYATSISLAKNIDIYTYNFSAGFSQLNGLTQLQAGLSLTYYPFKTTNYYGTSSLFYLNENSTNRIILVQKLGMMIVPKLWVEAGITYGNLQNFCENNAFVVFNTGDKILFKYGFSITSALLKHFEFSLRYVSFNRENIYYTVNDKLVTESIKNNYKTQTIIGGIKWKL